MGQAFGMAVISKESLKIDKNRQMQKGSLVTLPAMYFKRGTHLVKADFSLVENT